MSGLFSEINLLYVLCRVIMVFLFNFKIALCGQPVLTLDKRQTCSASCCLFEWTVNRVTLQYKKEFIMFNFFMVLLCVMIKCVWYAGHFEYSCMQCSCTTENKRHCDFKKLRKRLLTIKTRNIIRWNIYRDNNCYSRRQVLRVKCFWTSCRSYKKPCRYKTAFRCLLVFQDKLARGKSIAQSFPFLQPIFFRTFSLYLRSENV